MRHADRKDVIKVKRREFVALIGAAATAGPAIARGQIAAARRPLVAILTQRSPEAMRRYVNAFAQGMQELGLVAQRDYEIVLRSTDGDATRAPQLLQELIGLGPQVILTTDTTLALAAKRATKVIPIVGVLIAAPVAFGLVASLARPGGNVTGLLSSVDRLPAKQLELLLRIVPGATRIGLLLNVDNPANVGGVRLLETDAAVRQLKFVSAAIRSSAEIDPVFQSFTREHVEALYVFQDALFTGNAERIAALALAARLPTVFGFRELVEAGGLMSYGLNVISQWRRAAAYAAKILRGAKPADLPVEMQPSLELVVNLKTAKALGITVPASVLAFANDVIE
ncbi:MAG TPA: ABC transporter substrate-binding protein [Stellaceae bacterium]|nr:ABC transporter substrate-binding protein [Stellaceae bacterium]